MATPAPGIDAHTAMARRNTATRDKHRAAIARDQPPCWLCGGAIDYTLPHLDPGAYVVDHVIPLAKGGTDTLSNKRAAHRACNRAKSDKLQDAITSIFTTTTNLVDW